VKYGKRPASEMKRTFVLTSGEESDLMIAAAGIISLNRQEVEDEKTTHDYSFGHSALFDF